MKTTWTQINHSCDKQMISLLLKEIVGTRYLLLICISLWPTQARVYSTPFSFDKIFVRNTHQTQSWYISLSFFLLF